MKISTQAVVRAVTIFSVACLCTPTAVAQLKCEAQIRKTEIFPFEPLELLVSLRNTTSQIVVTQLSWGTWVQLGKHKDKAEGWEWSKPYQARAPGTSPLPLPFPPQTETFKPNEVKFTQVVSVRNAITGFGEEARPLLETPGRLAVRCAIGDVLSEPIVITVMQPGGLDAEAANALSGTELPQFFSEYSFNEMQVTKGKVEQLQEFAERYKGSVYADYATLGVGLMYLKGVRDEQDPKPEWKKDVAAAESYFSALSQKGGSVVKDRAAYYLAICRAERHQRQVAVEALENLASVTADPVVRFKARRSLESPLLKSETYVTPLPTSQPEQVTIPEPPAEQERRAVSAELWDAIEPWRRDLQQKLKAGAITQDEYERMLMVAQVKLTVTVQQRQREMRQKWKAGQITEQDYKQWLQKQAEELHQKWQPDISPNGATP